MNQRVKIKKSTKIDESENFENYTREELIEKIKSLSAHNIQLKNLLSKNTKADTSSRKHSKSFDFSKCTFQHIALQFLYLGWNYNGYVVQEDTTNTIEHHLFEALLKTKLIKDRASSNYHRCGRTDKGVSSFGQVISINLRTIKDDYCKILNRVLPNDIQCVAWSPVDDNFSARFDCNSRTYKYYFPKGDLNLEKMKEASQKLIGTHDFRNFCKMDVGNGVVEFLRNIIMIDIEKIDKHGSAYDMCLVVIEAKAFLWHQIRCIMGVLFLIGQGKEKPDVVEELLNVEKHPRKPEYSMASEVPLNLHYCDYDNITWCYDSNVLNQVIEKLNTAWTFHAIKEYMVKDMVKSVQHIRDKVTGNIKEKCLSKNLQNLQHKNYVPLLGRQTCDSLEEKIEHYKKRQRIEIINDNK